ncbi:unannotated protein [freshwater metagenome]|uniref:Unannotated protein n=1 Tax=freshwater metagenome TaxID=449393 RepID=A0A6J7HPY1_9ZZZZ|nr:hypothetical protein [Actinomycetota bacterium]
MEELPDNTWIDRTWMAYSRTILLVLAVGALLARGAYLRNMPIWVCCIAAVPALMLAVAILLRMRAISSGKLQMRRAVLVAMCVLVLACAILGALIAMMD